MTVLVGGWKISAVYGELFPGVGVSMSLSRAWGQLCHHQAQYPGEQEDFVDIAERIGSIINEPMVFRGKTVQVGTSIGIAM